MAVKPLLMPGIEARIVTSLLAPELWAITFSSFFMRCWAWVVVFVLSSCFRAGQVRWRNPAPLARSQLLDPWGRHYNYEPANRHPVHGTPRVYSLGPDPSDSGDVIANW